MDNGLTVPRAHKFVLKGGKSFSGFDPERLSFRTYWRSVKEFTVELPKLADLGRCKFNLQLEDDVG